LSNILSNPSNFTPITDLFPDIIIEPEITESEITESEITESEITESEITESEITESEITEPEQALDEEDNKPQKVVSNFTQEIANLKNSPAFQRTFPKLSLVPEANSKPPRRNLKPSLYNWLGFSFVRKKISKKSSQNLPQREKINPFLPEVKFLDEDALIIEEIAAEKSVPNEPAGITFNQDDISYIVIPDNLKIVAVDQEEEIITEKSFVTEMPRSQSTELALLAMELSQEIEQQSTPPTPELIDEDEEPVIDPQFMKMILMIAGDDHKGIEFLLNVIDSYLEEAPRLVQNIDKALAINSHARLLQSLNTLRLSSEYIGAVRLSYQCRQLESAVKANYVVLIYACLSRVAIELQQVTDSLRIERSRYT
jgi:HPt (histidine-containing phosphotransfer) domain-containing protein